ncbi:MAG: PAS domain-containing protein [Candidatus Nanopelagicales bacterium]
MTQSTVSPPPAAVLTGAVPAHTGGLATAPYRPWADHAEAGLAAVGLDERIRYVNDALCRLAGRPRSWFLGRPAPDLAPPEDVPLVTAAFVDVAEEPSGTVALEDRVRRPGDDPVRVRTTVRLVRDLRDDPVLYVCEYVDLDGSASAAAPVVTGRGSSASR